MKLEKRKNDEAQPSRAQSPKATVNKDNGLGFPTEATFSMGPNQMCHFIQGTATNRAHSASVKGKRKMAHYRALVISDSAVTSHTSSPKQASFASKSNFSYGASSLANSDFLFTASARKEIGKDGSTLGEALQPMVEAADQWTVIGRTMHHHVEIHSSDIGNKEIVRCEPCGESLREEDAGDRTNIYRYQEQQAHHQASASTLAHKQFQPPLSNHANEDGNSQVYCSTPILGKVQLIEMLRQMGWCLKER